MMMRRPRAGGARRPASAEFKQNHEPIRRRRRLDSRESRRSSRPSRPCALLSRGRAGILCPPSPATSSPTAGPCDPASRAGSCPHLNGATRRSPRRCGVPRAAVGWWSDSRVQCRHSRDELRDCESLLCLCSFVFSATGESENCNRGLFAGFAGA